MDVQDQLLARNREIATGFDKADLPILPKLRTVLVTCGDARVDPAHILGLELGEAVVIRNNGGRITGPVVDEIATLSVLVAAVTEGQEAGFRVILMQHTQCGAERFANPDLQATLKHKLGVDVSNIAITDHRSDLLADIGRLAAASRIPDDISVSALLYDVKTGNASEIAPPRTLADIRSGKPRMSLVKAN